jgi:ribosomal protein S8
MVSSYSSRSHIFRGMIEERRERALLSSCGCCKDPVFVYFPRDERAWPIHTHATILDLTPVLRRWRMLYLFSGYIGEFEIIDDHRSNKIVIELNGRLNKCGVISPRFDVTYGEIEKWIVNLLPSRQFGHVILSTTYGIMTHEEARRKKTGGKILGFFY